MNEPIDLCSERYIGIESSKSLIDAIFNKSNLMVAHMDATFNFIRVSKAYAEADQKPIDFFPGKNHFDLYPNDENEKIFRNVVATGAPFHIEKKDFEYVEHPERGTTVWEWSLLPLKDDHGIVESLVLTLKNITDQVNAISLLKRERDKSRESEEKFRTISEQSLIGIGILQERVLIYVNNTLANMLSLTVEELTSMSSKDLTKIVHPEDRDLILDQISRVDEGLTQEKSPFRIRWIPKEKKTLWIELFAKIISFEGRAAILFSCVDVTQNVLWEMKLKESEEKFRMLSEHSAVGISIIQYGIIKYANQRLLDFVGLTKNEILEFGFDKIIEIIHPDDRKLVLNLLNNIQKDINNSISHQIIRIIDKKGKVRWLEVFARSILYDGNPAYMNVSIDISNKKKAELELKESEKKYRALFEGSPIGIMLFDENYNFLTVNTEFTRLVPEVFNELVQGRNFSDMLKVFKNSEELKNIFLHRIEYLRDNQQLEPIEVKLVMPSGLEKWFYWQSSRIDLHDKTLIQILINDITEKKQIERLILKKNKELEEISEMRQEIINRISHELKTPVTSIYGAAQALLSTYSSKLQDEVIDFIEIIKIGGKRLKDLVVNLIDVVSMQSDVLKLNIEDVELSKLVERCARDFLYVARDRKVRMHLDISSPFFFPLDKYRMEQVFKNLISNALFNTPPGGEIHLGIKEYKKYLDILIKDTGVGITEKEKKKLFQVFGKIERYGKGQDVMIEGAGLGLYTSKQIVEKHGGTILVESNGRNQGTLFTVRLFK